MKKLFMILFAFFAVLTLSACQECEECEQCEECTECTECEECEECDECEECPSCPEVPQLAFYEEMSFDASGYTPAYNYYLSGTLNDDGEITSIRFNMVASTGVSKRSTDYKMNIAKFAVGGTSGNQTLKIFIGGSTENIAQVYNTISGDLTADGSETFKSLGIDPGYAGPALHPEEIFALLADGLDITIDDNTTVAEVLTAAGLYDATNSLVKNGTADIELTGYWGGGSYDNQLTALENHIVTNKLTLMEAYELVSQNNQGYDNRDAVAGATVMFDPKIVSIFAKTAGVEVNDDPVVVGNYVDGTNTIITVKVKGLKEITVQVTIDNTGTITTMEVKAHEETPGYGKDVIDGTYLDTIIAGQADLTAVDAVAGATMTSDALVEAAQTALDTYNN